MTLPAPAETATLAPIRVLAADRQPLFREAVARAVRQRSRFQLVAEVADGRAALDAIRRQAPDVAIVDVHLPGLDGGRILNAVVRDRIPTRILLLAGALDGPMAFDAIAAGAAGWVSRASGEAELCSAITAAAHGHVALTGDAQTAVAAEIRRRAAAGEPPLSERERLVLRLVADGWSTGEIGRRTHLSTGGVKSCLLTLYERLGVSGRAAAVAVAMRRGLID